MKQKQNRYPHFSVYLIKYKSESGSAAFYCGHEANHYPEIIVVHFKVVAKQQECSEGETDQKLIATI